MMYVTSVANSKIRPLSQSKPSPQQQPSRADTAQTSFGFVLSAATADQREQELRELRALFS